MGGGFLVYYRGVVVWQDKAVYHPSLAEVDTFAEVRQRDVLNLAEEMEHEIESDKTAWV